MGRRRAAMTRHFKHPIVNRRWAICGRAEIFVLKNQRQLDFVVGKTVAITKAA
jgi:hypothetical protein